MWKNHICKGTDLEEGAQWRAVFDLRDLGGSAPKHTHLLFSARAHSFSDPVLEVAPEALPLLCPC